MFLKIFAKDKSISLVLSAEGPGNSTKTLPGPDKTYLFALRHFRIEIKPSASGLCWDTKTLLGVAK
jgi:hypothetical protein